MQLVQSCSPAMFDLITAIIGLIYSISTQNPSVFSVFQVTDNKPQILSPMENNQACPEKTLTLMHYLVYGGSYVPVCVLFKQVKHVEGMLYSHDHLHLLTCCTEGCCRLYFLIFQHLSWHWMSLFPIPVLSKECVSFCIHFSSS